MELNFKFRCTSIDNFGSLLMEIQIYSGNAMRCLDNQTSSYEMSQESPAKNEMKQWYGC